MGGLERAEEEAVRLKIIAEENYRVCKLGNALKYAKRALRLCPDLDGVSQLVTALTILRIAKKSGGGTPDWYGILQTEPFSHINSIKMQYKKLSLTLHPDKNPSVLFENAFKLVGEAYSCLSNRIRKKEYDLILRVAMQSVEAAKNGQFWTVCSNCLLVHQFEMMYIGHYLMCPSCKKVFLAVAASLLAEKEDNMHNSSISRVRGNARVEKSVTRLGFKRKMGSVVEVLERSRTSPIVSTKTRPNNDNIADEMTLTEMLLEVKLRAREKKMLGKEMEFKAKNAMEMVNIESPGDVNQQILKIPRRRRHNSNQNNSVIQSPKEVEKDGLGIMNVSDSNFYDFGKDRTGKKFRKGQVWAIYDDADGMPRHYGLIEEVVSVNPFLVMLSWLELKNNVFGELVCSGFHVSSGKFKVTGKVSIDSVSIFSHVVDCEKAARELYAIYPKKGSVWALHKKQARNYDGSNPSIEDMRCYDIVLFLTSYSEMHGLSMAYLETVGEFKTVFRRKEIGCHAIRRIEIDDAHLLSHEIPARKLSGTEAPDLSMESWELDPASLPY